MHEEESGSTAATGSDVKFMSSSLSECYAIKTHGRREESQAVGGESNAATQRTAEEQPTLSLLSTHSR